MKYLSWAFGTYQNFLFLLHAPNKQTKNSVQSLHLQKYSVLATFVKNNAQFSRISTVTNTGELTFKGLVG